MICVINLPFGCCLIHKIIVSLHRFFEKESVMGN